MQNTYISENGIVMEAIEFIHKYGSYLDEIEKVIKPELQPVLVELRQIDPHDLVTPETWFPNPNDGRGYVWALFMNEVKKMELA